MRGAGTRVWLPALAIRLLTCSVTSSSSQGHHRGLHPCPGPRHSITNPRPLGFMLPSMKSTLAFLSLRRTLLTCGQIWTAWHDKGQRWSSLRGHLWDWVYIQFYIHSSPFVLKSFYMQQVPVEATNHVKHQP